MVIANTNSERMEKPMRKLRGGRKLLSIILIAVALMLFTAFSAGASEKTVITPISVVLDGDEVLNEGDAALLVDGVTFVPLRKFCTLLGNADVTWDASSSSANVRTAGLNINAAPGNRYLTVNDRIFFCSGANFIRNGTLYVPVRALAKAYGLDVEWKSKSTGAPGYVNLISSGKRAEDASDVYDSEVLYWLSRIISAESRGESLIGQIAVGNVVLNRTRSEQFPSTVYEVIFDTKFGVQFTPAASGTIYEEPAESSIIAAKICLEGYSLSEDILYFLNESISTNMWVTNNRTYVMTLGNHTFYS